MPNDYLSKEKHEELKNELEDLRLHRRKEVAERLEFAKSLGDLSENAEYQAAREEQSDVEDRISQLENLLKNAVLLTAHHSSVVEIGSTLSVERLADKAKSKLMIVGSEDTDIPAGKISSHSPLGAALIGKERGATVTLKTPRGEVAYKIVSID